MERQKQNLKKVKNIIGSGEESFKLLYNIKQDGQIKLIKEIMRDKVKY